jgi:Rieske Fe-S protein
MHSHPENEPPLAIKPPQRRQFFRWLSGIVAALAGLVAGIPLVGYFLGRRARVVHWVALGRVEEFPEDETRMATFDNPLKLSWDGITAHTGVYVRHETVASDPNRQFLVLAVNCAHLGCPVAWFPQSGLFMCPCHGGVYYASGERASGPPPRGLFHCVWRVRRGQLEIQAPHYPTLQDTLEDTA